METACASVGPPSLPSVAGPAAAKAECGRASEAELRYAHGRGEGGRADAPHRISALANIQFNGCVCVQIRQTHLK